MKILDIFGKKEKINDLKRRAKVVNLIIAIYTYDNNKFHYAHVKTRDNYDSLASYCTLQVVEDLIKAEEKRQGIK